MACRFEVTLLAEDATFVRAASLALDLADELEARLSHFREESELMRMNRSAALVPVPAAPEMLALLRLCLDIHSATDGAFDVTTTPLSRAWGFLDRRGHVPAPEVLRTARACAGCDKIQLDEARGLVRFAVPGVEVSFGGVGKGWALDRMAEALGARGVARALLSAGGSSFRAVGGERGEFVVDVCPDHDGPIARVRLEDAAFGASTAAEQWFEADGRRYGHVLDPRTGQPAAGVRAAVAITSQAAVADALATAFFVGGPALAERYCATHANTLALLAPEDGGPSRVFGDCDGAVLEEVR
jgi:thiamine biosynthesis lipoprotein